MAQAEASRVPELLAALEAAQGQDGWNKRQLESATRDAASVLQMQV